MLSHRSPPAEVAVKSTPMRISVLHEQAPPAPPPAAPRPRPHTVVRRRVAAPPVVPAAPGKCRDCGTAAANGRDDRERARPAGAGQTVSAANIEAQYAAALRTNIDSRTTVPNSLEYRLFKPRGAARVSFTLERDGTADRAAVVHGSGSNILDRQALNIVQSGRYPPFPERAFPGEARHVFVVTIEFQS